MRGSSSVLRSSRRPPLNVTRDEACQESWTNSEKSEGAALPANANGLSGVKTKRFVAEPGFARLFLVGHRKRERFVE